MNILILLLFSKFSIVVLNMDFEKLPDSRNRKIPQVNHRLKLSDEKMSRKEGKQVQKLQKIENGKVKWNKLEVLGR